MSKYLVIQLARLGDLLQAKRLIGSLLAEPGAKADVHLLVDHSLKEFAELIYPQVQVQGITAHKKKDRLSSVHLLKEVQRVMGDLGKISFDRIINLNYSGLNYALAARFDSQKVFGYRWQNGQFLKGKWPEFAFRWSKRRRQSGLNLMDFWAAYAPYILEPEAVNPLPESKGGGVGLVLSGRHSRRSIPPEFLAAYAQAALQGVGHGPLFLLGTEAEKPLAREFRKSLKPQVRDVLQDMVGKTSLSDLMEIVSGLDLLLSPDTGTMHLAAHLGTPVQAFFLSSAWCFETGVYGQGHRIWQAVCPCVPCLEGRKCAEEMSCLQPFGHKAILQFLAQGRAKQLPEDLLLLESDFDQIGVVYRPRQGIEPCQEERKRFRAMLAPYFNQELSQAGFEKKIDDFYLERDWMLEG